MSPVYFVCVLVFMVVVPIAITFLATRDDRKYDFKKCPRCGVHLYRFAVSRPPPIYSSSVSACFRDDCGFSCTEFGRPLDTETFERMKTWSVRGVFQKRRNGTFEVNKKVLEDLCFQDTHGTAVSL